jgi:hypothetical protein
VNSSDLVRIGDDGEEPLKTTSLAGISQSRHLLKTKLAFNITKNVTFTYNFRRTILSPVPATCSPTSLPHFVTAL